jgi:hypothetical protein
VLCCYLPVENHLVIFSSFFIQGSDRLNRMNQAAKYFLLQTVENGSWVGMVHFDSTASIKSELIQIKGNTERNTLLERLPSVASGGTSICKGIQAAFQVKITLQIFFCFQDILM